MSDLFRAGDPVELLQLDKKAKPYLARLQESGTINVRGHRFPHAALVGHPVGVAITSEQGATFFPVRPTLARWVETMPRFAKTIYPKEAGPILLYADIRPGDRVLEAGLGSGGLTLSLLRAVGAEGHLTSYDVRAASLKKGADNVAVWYGGPHPRHTIRERDVYEGIDEEGLDRIVLDVPEPWQVIPHLRKALRPGGIFAAFLPTVLQVHQLVEALKEARSFPDVETLETLQRRWFVGSRSVRPETMMVGHTGFITVARCVAGVEAASAPEPDTESGTE